MNPGSYGYGYGYGYGQEGSNGDSGPPYPLLAQFTSDGIPVSQSNHSENGVTAPSPTLLGGGGLQPVSSFGNSGSISSGPMDTPYFNGNGNGNMTHPPQNYVQWEQQPILPPFSSGIVPQPLQTGVPMYMNAFDPSSSMLPSLPMIPTLPPVSVMPPTAIFNRGAEFSVMRELFSKAQTSINRVDERLAYYRFHLANKFGNARASELVREMMSAEGAGLRNSPFSVPLLNSSTIGHPNQIIADDFSSKKDADVEPEPEADFEDVNDVLTYDEYTPRFFDRGVPHPDPLIQSASMAAVDPPPITYQLQMPSTVVDHGLLSCPQLETVTYASQMFEQLLPGSNYRRGFFLGDGAGVGKGRQLAGIMFESWSRGLRRHVWLSVSTDLYLDAQRDLKDIGAGHIKSVALHKLPYAPIDLKEGIVFATYSSLISASGHSKNPRKKKKIFHTRIGQLIQWCMGMERSINFGTNDAELTNGVPTDLKATFQGCMLFDECHRAKKFYNGSNGKPSQSGKAVFAFQHALPGARVVYCSATGISQPSNMGYMTRLGLWGPETSFPEFPNFLDAVEKGGIGMSELVAMQLRRIGGYLCRTLSFATCSFETIETGATGEGLSGSFDFQRVFDEATSLWQAIYRDLIAGLNEERFDYAVAKPKDSKYSDDDSEDEWIHLENRGVAPLFIPAGKRAKTTVLRYFWGAHQRFFHNLCISLKVPTAVQLAKEAIAEGKCVVIGMQTTGESAMKQSQDFDDVFSSDSKDDTGDDDDFISSPAMTLQNVILKCFPRPAFSDIPSKHRRAIKKRKELRSLRHNSMFTSDIVDGGKRTRRCKQTTINYASDGLNENERQILAGRSTSIPAEIKEIETAPPTESNVAGRVTNKKPSKREEMIAEGWEFEKGSIVVRGCFATAKERGYVGVDCRRFIDGKHFDGYVLAVLPGAKNEGNPLWHMKYDDDDSEDLDADEVEGAIDAFERDLKRPSSVPGSSDEEVGGLMRLRGGGPGRKRCPPQARGGSSSQGAKRTRVFVSDNDSSSEESGYESSSSYHGSESSVISARKSNSDSIAESAIGSVNGDESPSLCVKEDKNIVNTTTGESSTPRETARGSTAIGIADTASDDEEDEVDDEDGKSDDPKNLFNIRAKYMKMAQELQLPGNPLDTLIDQLGGVIRVAELTGRKGRMIRMAKPSSKAKLKLSDSTKPSKRKKGKVHSIFTRNFGNKSDNEEEFSLEGSDEVSDDDTSCSGTQLVYQKRNANGISLENQNMYEKDQFMAGKKLIAIISEAASSGISLQADRRVKNQKRRVHITLELPWSAERAVQQLGRTHRSNQSSGPEYKLLISPCGGERRFAAAVAKRLESLGALTLGDRRASVGAKTLSMSSFNFDTKYGKQALDEIICWIANTIDSAAFRDIEHNLDHSKELIQLIVDDVQLRSWLLRHIPQQELAKLLESKPIPFALIARVWLYSVGIDVAEKVDVRRFLNRILGLEVDKQNLLFNLFLNRLDGITRIAKRDGTYDTGVKELTGGRVYENKTPEIVYSTSSSSGAGKMTTLLHEINVDRGIPWSEIEVIHNTTTQQEDELENDKSATAVVKKKSKNFLNVKLVTPGFYRTIRGFRGNHFVIYAREKDDVHEFQTSNILCYRPQTGKHETMRSMFYEKYEKISFEKAHVEWVNEFELNTKRVVTWYMLSGAVLPVWKAIAASLRMSKGPVRIMRAVLQSASVEDDSNSSEVKPGHSGSDVKVESVSSVNGLNSGKCEDSPKHSTTSTAIGIWLPTHIVPDAKRRIMQIVNSEIEQAKLEEANRMVQALDTQASVNSAHLHSAVAPSNENNIIDLT